MKNNGTIGDYTFASENPDKYWAGDELALINEVIIAYVTYLNSEQVWVYNGRPWSEAKNDVGRKWDFFIAWCKADCGVFNGTLGNGNAINLKVTDYTASANVIAAVKAGLDKYKDVNGNALLGKDIKSTYDEPILYEVTSDNDAVLRNYIIVRNNYGTFDMTATDIDITTIGDIVDNTMGTKKGEFTVKVLESGLVTLDGNL